MNKAFLSIVSGILFSAQVFAANVNGVVWNPDEFSEMDSGAFAQIFNSATGTLSGWGAITGFNNDVTTDICPGCELTYVFDGFQIDEAQSSISRLIFTGGTVNFYTQAPGNFAIGDRATAEDGDLWLSLSGRAFLDLFNGGGETGSLSANLLSGVAVLDVIDGPAAPYFDTNTISDFSGGFGDFLVSSSVTSYFPTGTISGTGVAATVFLNDVVAVAIDNGILLDDKTVNVSNFFNTTMGLSQVVATGSLDARGDSVNVPEPTMLSLLGLGLLGFGAATRSRKVA